MHLGWKLLPLLVACDLTILISAAAEMKVPVRFSRGHQIGKNDFGRPVVLIAAALGVKPEVFREAFSGVTPAQGRAPSGEEARKNKAALMKVLAPHGVTNERLEAEIDGEIDGDGGSLTDTGFGFGGGGELTFPAVKDFGVELSAGFPLHNLEGHLDGIRTPVRALPCKSLKNVDD